MPLLVLYAIAAALSAAPAGEIAFVSGAEQEQHCVFILDLGSNQERRVGPGKYDGAPVWSPDGQWLAFESSRGEAGFGVYAVRENGADGHFLASAGGVKGPPAWSPDSRRVAYAIGEAGKSKLHVTEIATGSDAIWGGETPPPLAYPTWMSNDRILAVAMVGLPGKQTTDLDWVTATSASRASEAQDPKSQYVKWAPTACPAVNAVAYESNDGGDREIFVYIMNRGVVDVSNDRAADWNPAWAPEGSWVAFESFRKGRRGIYRVNPVRILVYEIAASPEWDDWAPSWSPDGNWLAFISTRAGAPKLFAAQLDGSGPRALTNHAAPDFAPAWRPAPKAK